MSNLEQIKIVNSITNNDEFAEDKNTPFSFATWLEKANISPNNAEKYISEYNSYVREWSSTRKKNNTLSSDTTDVYKTLLEEITLNYTTDEERRFLKTIDYNQPEDIETTASFFSKRLKQITLYLSDKREDIKQQPAKYSLAGTNKGIEILVRKIISQLLSDDIFLEENIASISVAEKESIRVDIQELYDINENYFNIDPVSDKSIYTDSDTTRSRFFKSESLPYDPYIWIDFEKAIQNLLRDNVSGVLGDDPLTSLLTNTLDNIQVNTGVDINDLHESHFFNYIKSKENLNLYLIKKLVEESTGTDMYYVSSNESGPYIKKLFNASKQVDNFYNTQHPTRSNIPDNILRTSEQLGGCFTSHNLGTYTCYSKLLGYKLIKSKVSDNSVYILPDPEVEGDSTGLIDYHEDLSHIITKHPTLSTCHADHNNNVPYFYNYQSHHDENSLTVNGISKETDSFDFWEAQPGKVWKNKDIFKYSETDKQSSITDRYNKLLHKNETVYKQSSDIYGNIYALFKKIKPQSQVTDDNYVNRCASDRSTRYNYTGIIDSIYANDIHYEPRSRSTSVFNVDNFSIATYSASSFSASHTNTLFGGSMASTTGFARTRYGAGFLPQLGQPVVRESCVVIQGEAMPEDFYSANISLCGTCDGWNCTTGVSSTTWDGKTFSSNGYDWCTSIDVSVYDLDITDTSFEPSYASYLDNTQSQSTSKLSFKEKNSLNKPISIYNQLDVNGQLWVRNINSTIIDRYHNVFHSVILKYGGSNEPGLVAVSNELKSSIRDIEIIQDVIYIQTESYIVIERINYDYATNSILPSTNENIYYSIPVASGNGGKVIRPFYNEQDNILIFGYTEAVVCGGAQTFVPTLYSIDIETLRSEILTSADNTNAKHNFRIPQSVYNSDIQGITNINRPILSYNKEVEKYILVTVGELATLEATGSGDPTFQANGHICVIKTEYKHTPTSKLFNIIDNTMYCLDDDNIRRSKTYTNTEREIYQYINTSVNQYNIDAGHPVFAVVFDSRFVRQAGDAGVITNNRDSKIIKIEYDFGDGSPNVIVNRKLSYDSNDSGTIRTISTDNDINDPRLQKIRHTYHINGVTDDVINATIRIVYASGFIDTKYIRINTKEFNHYAFFDMNLLDINAFIDQYNKETVLLTFELGDDSNYKNRRVSTVALY